MSSTLKPIVNDDIGGGLNSSASPQAVESREWTKLYGMRYERGALVQLPQLKRAGQVMSEKPIGPALIFLGGGVIAERVNGVVGATVMAGYSDLTGKASRILSPVDSRLPQWLGKTPTDVFDFSIGSKALSTGSCKGYLPYSRFAVAKYSDALWVTSKYQTLAEIRDGSVYQEQGVDLPKGSYIMSLFDHMVVGRYSLRGRECPRGIAWSDKWNPWKWSPGKDNEADSIDFEEFSNPSSFVVGVTGMMRQADAGVVFTDSSIIRLRYVGLPNIMYHEPLTMDVGNGLPFGLVSHAGVGLFFDRGTMNFYSLSTEGLAAIGDKIVDHFLSTTTDPSLEYVVGQYVPQWNTAVWMYPGKPTASSNECLMAIGYNWKQKSWSAWYYNTAKYPIQCLAINGTVYEPIDDVTGTINSVTGMIDEYQKTTFTTLGNVWATNGYVTTELSTGFEGTVQDYAPVLLETGDRVYGNVNAVKEVAGISLQATYAVCSGGLEISLSVRERYSDPVNYNVVGFWHPNLRDNTLFFPRPLAGKIFRWRIQPAKGYTGAAAYETFGLVINSFTELVYDQNTER